LHDLLLEDGQIRWPRLYQLLSQIKDFSPEQISLAIAGFTEFLKSEPGQEVRRALVFDLLLAMETAGQLLQDRFWRFLGGSASPAVGPTAHRLSILNYLEKLGRLCQDLTLQTPQQFLNMLQLIAQSELQQLSQILLLEGVLQLAVRSSPVNPQSATA
jgi:hypothetical protein